MYFPACPVPLGFTVDTPAVYLLSGNLSNVDFSILLHLFSSSVAHLCAISLIYEGSLKHLSYRQNKF